MSFTINIYYTGQNGSAKEFANEMVQSGVVDRVRSEPGNLKYEYFFPMDDPETVLLIDRWEGKRHWMLITNRQYQSRGLC